MAKKRRFFPRRRTNPQAAEQRSAEQNARIERAAQELVASKSVEELKLLLATTREAYEEADQLSIEEPGPAALVRYRNASQALAEVERAMELAAARTV